MTPLVLSKQGNSARTKPGVLFSGEDDRNNQAKHRHPKTSEITPVAVENLADSHGRWFGRHCRPSLLFAGDER